ncbi:MAG: hypothetical protein ACPGSC_11275 [Granulosicoccaceae bacterium]
MTGYNPEKQIETFKSLWELQMETTKKTFELQQSNSAELVSYMNSETEKAKSLQSPQEMMQFSLDMQRGLFDLAKAQGEALTQLAVESNKDAMDKLKSMAEV